MSEESLSDCCGALIFWGDICAACGEHCDVEKQDEEEWLEFQNVAR